jgi:hypothetical protein
VNRLAPQTYSYCDTAQTLNEQKIVLQGSLDSALSYRRRRIAVVASAVDIIAVGGVQ